MIRTHVFLHQPQAPLSNERTLQFAVLYFPHRIERKNNNDVNSFKSVLSLKSVCNNTTYFMKVTHVVCCFGVSLRTRIKFISILIVLSIFSGNGIHESVKRTS